MVKTKNKEKIVEIKIQPLNIETIKIKIKGVTPLLMGKVSDEVKEGILAKQVGVSKSNKKKVRDTKQEVLDAIHVLPNGDIGFPVHGFKHGMMEVTSFVGDKMFSRKLVSGAVKIINGVNGLVPIKYKKQDVLIHTVMPNTMFTPQFHDWSCELHIQYDANNIAPADIMTLLNYAGFYNGIGMWRPKGRDGGSGEYGVYEVIM